MIGARYEGELFARFDGDREAGKLLLPEARKVLGGLLADAEHNQLISHKCERRYESGAIIVAEKIGDLKRVAIFVPPVGGYKPPVEPPEDFVVWAREDSSSSGIDPEFPQQILREPGDTGAWKTFFYNSTTGDYDGFGGSKGTYGGLFPEGIRHAGNIDWESAEGLVINWFGPYHRYWLEAFVQPRRQFGSYVFMYGEAVLDVEDYIAGSPEQTHGEDKYILGAALRKIEGTWYLYTVQSEAADEPVAAGPSTNASIAPVYGCVHPRTNNVGGIYRYTLYTEPNVAGVTKFRVQYDSRQLMLVLSDSHCEPWFFNQSCTLAHCFALDTDGWLAQTIPRPTDLDPEDIPPDFVEYLPATSQVLREVTFTELGASIAETTLSVVPGDSNFVPFARDYKGDEPVDAGVSNMTSMIGTGGNRWGVRYSIAGNTFIADLGGDPLDNPWPNNPSPLSAAPYIVFADLRKDIVVLLTYYMGNIIVGGAIVHLRVYRGQTLEYSFDVSGDLVESIPWGMPEVGLLATTYVTSRITVAPSFFAYGTYNCPYIRQTPPSPDTVLAHQGTGGIIASTTWFPRPFSHYYGLVPNPYITGRAWSHPWLLPQAAPGGGASEDFLGHFTPFSLAANDETIMLSGWSPYVTSDDGILTMHYQAAWAYVTDTDLPTLTGVGDDSLESRYHPLWRLGKPITP